MRFSKNAQFSLQNELYRLNFPLKKKGLNITQRIQQNREESMKIKCEERNTQ